MRFGVRSAALGVLVSATAARAQTTTVRIDSIKAVSATIVIQASSDDMVTLIARGPRPGVIFPLFADSAAAWAAAIDSVDHLAMAPKSGEEVSASAETSYPTIGWLRFSRVITRSGESMRLTIHSDRSGEVFTSLARSDFAHFERALSAAVQKSRSLSGGGDR